MASPIREIPPRDDLLTLARAALSNAGELIADARLLAQAGRFPRAHALATLACEELGKSDLCLQAIWLPGTPRAFWDQFGSHSRKLWSAQGAAVRDSGDRIVSAEQYNERVRNGSRYAHERKLRGLYVDYGDRAVQLPGDITEQETWQIIDRAQKLFDAATARLDGRLEQIDWWCKQPAIGPVVWIYLIARLAEEDIDATMAMLRGDHTGVFERLQGFADELLATVAKSA